MHSGAALLETSIAHGGFKIERRKLKLPDGGSTAAECLVSVWPSDDTSAVRPLAEQPCLHRVLADCHGPEGILWFANLYGLLTVAASRTANGFPPETLDTWHKEIRALRTCTAVSDAVASKDETELRHLLQHPKADVLKQGREFLMRKLAEKMAGVRFDLVVAPDGEQDQFIIRYRPLRLIDPETPSIRTRGNHRSGESVPLPVCFGGMGHLAGVRRRNCRRPVSSTEVWSVVPEKHWEKRPRVLPRRLPDSGSAQQSGRDTR